MSVQAEHNIDFAVYKFQKHTTTPRNVPIPQIICHTIIHFIVHAKLQCNKFFFYYKTTSRDVAATIILITFIVRRVVFILYFTGSVVFVLSVQWPYDGDKGSVARTVFSFVLRRPKI